MARRRRVVCKVHSRSLPYYYNNKVSFFDLEGKKHIVRKEDFMDITSEAVSYTHLTLPTN